MGVRDCAGLLPFLLPSGGSAQVRPLALFQEVLEPEILGVAHRQLLNLFGRNESELGGLVGDLQPAADDAGGEANVELAADLSLSGTFRALWPFKGLRWRHQSRENTLHALVGKSDQAPPAPPYS